MTRTIGIFTSMLGLALAMTGCSSSSDTAQKKTITRTASVQSVFTPTELETTVNSMVAAINAATPTSMQLNVILKQVSTYFTPVVIGSNRAMQELQYTGGTTAPGEADGDAATADQISMINDDISQGTKGLGIAPFRSDVTPSLNAAVAAGVPVVTLDSDEADSNRDLYIGTQNAAAGTTAGNTLKGFLPPAPGTVVILGQGDNSWPDGFNRTNGAKDVLTTAGYTVTVVTANWSDSGVTDLATLAGLFTTADPPIVGMAGMFSNAFECAQAAEAAGKTGDTIAIVAFDFDPNTVTYMQKGFIKATHAQRQYYMGYLTPYVLYGMNVLGKAKTKEILSAQMVDQFSFNTGLDVVQASQMDAYSAFLDQLGIGSSN
jgi:ribose transport system substrate-binding protein